MVGAFKQAHFTTFGGGFLFEYVTFRSVNGFWEQRIGAPKNSRDTGKIPIFITLTFLPRMFHKLRLFTWRLGILRLKVFQVFEYLAISLVTNKPHWWFRISDCDCDPQQLTMAEPKSSFEVSVEL